MPERLQTSPRLSEQEMLERCGWPACRAACCVYGTWVDESEIELILANQDMVRPHLPAERGEASSWFGRESESDRFSSTDRVLHTSVIADPEHYGGSSCIFMRPDYKCALQVAGEQNGLHPWHFKPFYCVLHPLDLDEHGRLTLDRADLMAAEPASCLRAAAEPVELAELFRKEIEFLTARGNQKGGPGRPALDHHS